jgi:NAD(P)-dependent dehydrogenase (short-subunit alcohol dehydrogenase family)
VTARGPLAGKVAIVTGAAKGIGGVVTEHLARDGADVVLVGRDAEALERRAKEVDVAHPDRESLTVPCDVTVEAQVAALMEAAVERFGGIDILVNAAGGTGPIETPAHEYPTEEFRAILELNVLGTFLPCKHAIPHLRAAADGS